MANELLVDGVEFPPDGWVEWPMEWAYAARPASGDATTYLNMDGGSMGDPTYPPTIESIVVSLFGDCDEETWGHANQRYRNMIQACKPGRDVVLTRRREYPSNVVEEQTCRARYIQSSLTRPQVAENQAVVDFVNLDGLWYGDEVIEAAPGTLTVPGDVRTHRMTVTLTGTDPVLTNTTTGSVLSYTGDATGGVTLEVDSVTVLSGSVANWSWNQRLPFRLLPGENVLTVTGGTASITYQPAYL